MDLSGTWRAVPSDETIRRRFAEVEHDDSTWEPIAVPSHWQSTPAFADHHGALLYRTRFETAPLAAGERAWLVFDGLFYQGDVWLDGVYLGDTEGYFNRHTFEITEDLGLATEHVLAVEATCARHDDTSSKRNITGVFQHADYVDPDWNPGGIWRGVRIERTGPVRARALRVVCTSASPERAVIACRAELDTDEARSVTIRTTVAGVEQADERPLAKGSNFVEWQVAISRPSLWWPHALGDQPLHEVEVEVCVDDAPSHRVGRRTGFRSLTWKSWTLSVNGERLFLKGATLPPTRVALAEATEVELRADVERARDAGLDLVRLQGHVSRAELYRAADEVGMLVWQDFPLQWRYGRGIRKQAKRQASAMVDMLGHRPSIALWCGHNEPHGDGEGLREVVAQELPTFNRTILDRTVKRAIERADPSRPVVAHSGVWPHPGGGGTDAHLRFDSARELAGFARAFPRMVRFVGELPGDPHQVDVLRRLKYRPTGGFCTAVGELVACAPLAVVCEEPPAEVAPGQALALDVHVVSDRRTPIDDAEVLATARWEGGEQRWRWRGTVPADGCARVGTLALVVPDVPGPLTIDVALGEVANRYVTTISS